MENAWEQLEWSAAARARAVGLACRLDRQLEAVAAVAEGPESRLAARLRSELQEAVTGGLGESSPDTDALFAAVESTHERLAYLPKTGLPAGVRVFLRELFGRKWDENVVVAAVSKPRWPVGHETGEAEGRTLPVTVIPRAELRNPLMWPLIAVQGARIAGWAEPEERVREAAGPGVWFALAEAMLQAGESDAEARALWQRGRDELEAAGELYDAALELASELADGILISARRVGVTGLDDDASPQGNVSSAHREDRPDGDRRDGDVLVGRDGGERGLAAKRAEVYRQLSAVRDVPARPVEILSAGWIHWYRHAAPSLLAASDWSRMREIVDGVDDVLCRSLDVAAIHRFYATGGASA